MDAVFLVSQRPAILCFASVVPSILPQHSAVVCAFQIPFCPRICVCSMYSIDLVASCGLLKIARRSSRPVRLPRMRFRVSLYIARWRSMCATVSRLSPHGQRGMVTSGTFRVNRKSLSTYFPVEVKVCVENISITCHEDVRSCDLRRSIFAELRIVSNRYTLQPLSTSAETSIR